MVKLPSTIINQPCVSSCYCFTCTRHLAHLSLDKHKLAKCINLLDFDRGVRAVRARRSRFLFRLLPDTTEACRRPTTAHERLDRASESLPSSFRGPGRAPAVPVCRSGLGAIPEPADSSAGAQSS